MDITYVNNQEAAYIGTTSPITISIDIGTRTDGMLKVAFNAYTPNDPNITSITYNGVSLSKAVDQLHFFGGYCYTSIWYLVNPSNGSNNLVITFSGNLGSASVWVDASWYDGVLQNQSTVLDQVNSSEGTSYDPTVNITPGSDGQIVIGTYVSEVNSPLTVGGETEINNYDWGGNSTGASYAIQTTAQQQTVDWSGAGPNDDWSICAATFKPAASGAIEEAASAAKYIGISSTNIHKPQDAVTAIRYSGISILTQSNERDGSSLIRYLEIIVLDETVIGDTTSLNRSAGLSIFEELGIYEAVGFNRGSGISLLEQGILRESIALTRLAGVVVSESVQTAAIEESATLIRSAKVLVRSDVFDNFNRASLGSDWTVGTGTVGITNNQLTCSVAEAKLWWNSDEIADDQWVEAKQYGTNWRGITARVSGSGDNIYGYVAWISSVGVGVTLRLGWHNGGTDWGEYLDGSGTTITCSEGATLKLEVTGQDPNIVLKVYVNGSLVKTLNQASFTNPAAILASGKVGLYFFNATAIFDDFNGGPIQPPVIEEAVTFTRIAGITPANQISIQNAITNPRSGEIVPLDQIVIGELGLFNYLDALTASEEAKAYSGTSLEHANEINTLDQIVIYEEVSIGRSAGLTSEEEIGNVTVYESVTLIEFIGIANATLLNAQDVIIFERYAASVEDTNVFLESITTLEISKGIGALDQVEVENSNIFDRLAGVNVAEAISGVAIEEAVNLEIYLSITQHLPGIIDEAVIFSLTIETLSISQSNQQDTVLLNRLSLEDALSITNESDFIILDHSNTISEIDQTSENDSVNLERFNAIDEIDQTSENDSVNLERFNGIIPINQTIEYDTTILAEFLGIAITDETLGQYSETVIFNRFLGLTVFQEGISHVSESISFNRLNLININERIELYNNLIFNRSNLLTIFPEYQLFNSLIFSKSGGLSFNAQNLGNENITVSKFNGLNTNSQIIIPEFINLFQSYILELFDSRYLLESISLEHNSSLSLIDSPTIFETIQLGKINILTIMAMLYGFNSVTFDQFKSIIAEPPALYVYADGNHSIGVIFRDKRCEVVFRDKRTSVIFRDKRCEGPFRDKRANVIWNDKREGD